MSLQQLSCPSCGASAFSREADGNLVCGACGNVYQRTRNLECPICHTMNPEDAQRCIRCGSALVRQCPVCHHNNPPDAEYCGSCGEILDALAFVFQRYAEASEHSAARRADKFSAVKHTDNEYMREQRARLDAEERERMAQLEVVHERARRQQKMVITAGLAITFLAIAVIIVLIVIQISGA